METRPGWPEEMMRKAPASHVPFAADPSFSPAQRETCSRENGDRAGRTRPVSEEACAIVLAVICRGVGEQLEVWG